ncbi:MAG: polyphosphate kinase 2 [Pseudomonadota bacterium]
MDPKDPQELQALFELESIVDQLAYEDFEVQAPLAHVRERSSKRRPGRKIIQQYFATGEYPYADRMAPGDYYRAKHKLQIELVKLQNWVKTTGQRVVVVFEGRDAAGKGSTIKRFMEYLNPRVARVVALTVPTEEESGQWYFQRYITHLPTKGEIVFFDRSWYNRAGVERVMGFCTEEEYETFVAQAPEFERMLMDSGIALIKFYLSINREEQQARFLERETNPLKTWKLSPMDREAQKRWDDYTEAKEASFRRTSTSDAPWIIVKGEDKLRARLECMRYVLRRFDYEGRNNAAIGDNDPLLIASAQDLKAISII